MPTRAAPWKYRGLPATHSEESTIMKKTRVHLSFVFAASAFALAVGLSGCAGSGAPVDAERDDAGQVTEEAEVDIAALKVGDCTLSSSSGLVSDASVVPCSEPHAEEVFFEFELKKGDFPGNEAIAAEVEAKCDPAFAEFIGIAWEESALQMSTIQPTEQTWDEYDDRVVQCIVFDSADDQLVGSLAGAAR